MSPQCIPLSVTGVISLKRISLLSFSPFLDTGLASHRQTCWPEGLKNRHVIKGLLRERARASSDFDI